MKVFKGTFVFALLFVVAFSLLGPSCFAATIPDPSPDVPCNGVWTFAANLGGWTPSIPAIQYINGRIIVVARGGANDVWVKEWNGISLTDWYVLNSGSTPDSPKLVLENGSLWVYVNGMSGYIYRSQYLTQGSWSSWDELAGNRTTFGIAGPSSVVTGIIGNAIYRVVNTSAIELDVCTKPPTSTSTVPLSSSTTSAASSTTSSPSSTTTIQTSTTSTSSTTSTTSLLPEGTLPDTPPEYQCKGFWEETQSLSGSTSMVPAMAYYNSKLIISVTGGGNAIFVKEWKDGDLTDWYALPGSTSNAPKLVIVNGELWMYVIGSTNTSVWKSKYISQGSWTDWVNAGVEPSVFGNPGPSSTMADYSGSQDGYRVVGGNPIELQSCNLNPPGTTLFSDNFDNGLVNGWNVTYGSWHLENGRYRGESVGPIDWTSADRQFIWAYSTIGDQSWKSYSLEATVTPVNYCTLSAHGLIVRYKDDRNYAMVYLSQGGGLNALQFVDGNQYSVISPDQKPTLDWAANRNYKFKVEVVGNRLSVDVNGTRLNGTIYPSLMSGGIGLVSFDGASYFDNVTVKSISSPTITYTTTSTSTSTTTTVTPKFSGDYQVLAIDSLNKLKLEESKPPAGKSNVEINASRNEFESFQVMINPNIGLRDISLYLSDFKSSKGIIRKENVSAYIEGFVNIMYPNPCSQCPPPLTGNLSDPLTPFNMSGKVNVTAKVPYAFWLTLYVPNGVPAGDYTSTLTIRPSNSISKSIPIKLHVYNFSLPAKPSLDTYYELYEGEIMAYYNVTQTQTNSIVEQQFLKSYADHRIEDPCWIVPQYGADSNGTLSLDTADFGRQMGVCLDGRKAKFVILGALIPDSILGYPKHTARYENLTVQLWKAVSGEIAKSGRASDAVFHYYIYDEPKIEDYNDIRYYAGLMRLGDPDKVVKILLTEQPVPQLFGYVDIWVPHYSIYSCQYGTINDYTSQRIASGDKVYWYVTAQHPGYNIDRSSVEYRVFPWLTWKYNLTGTLYWSVDYWTRNYWAQPYYQGGTSGQGDGFLYYNPCNTADGICKTPVTNVIIPSVRLEVLRDGMEDYEYLYILNQTMQKAASIPAAAGEVAKAQSALSGFLSMANLTGYTQNNALVYNSRNKVAREIEALQKYTNQQPAQKTQTTVTQAAATQASSPTIIDSIGSFFSNLFKPSTSGMASYVPDALVALPQIKVFDPIGGMIGEFIQLSFPGQ